MNPLYLAIKAYQKFPLVNRAVRGTVHIHHKVRKPDTRPCPYRAEGCSRHFAAQARVAGIAALPAILSAMSICGPGDAVCLGDDECGNPAC